MASSRVSTAFSILAGPVIWLEHFVAVYAASEFGCRANFSNLAVLPPSTIRTFILLATLAALAGIAAGGYVGWQRLAALRVDGVAEVESRQHFMAVMGLAFTVLFFFAVVVSIIPMFILGVCGTAI